MRKMMLWLVALTTLSVSTLCAQPFARLECSLPGSGDILRAECAYR